jgi:glycosyltransferase involved in cell wall biosynthesis
MLLSVIIPSYNFENYIVECVRSVTSQITDFDFEILIRDDHSGDNTNKLLREEFGSDPRVVIFDSKENLGAYGNIKYLLENSRGKYASILDGDDYLNNPHKFQMQIDFLESNPDYVMHSTGYITLLPDGTIDPPEPGYSKFPRKNEVDSHDLLYSNIVSFGRTFRNIPGAIKEWMRDFPYLDWAFNYEISLHGKIRCDNWNCGVYRHSEQGMFSLKSEEEKDENNKKAIEIISRRVKLVKAKTISIIDCFVHDSKVESNLIECINRLKLNGHDVFLISNTSIRKDILEAVDYHFYDSRNQLFKKDYPGVNDVDFWSNQGHFTVHNLKSGLQKHGLSVLINLFNALDIAKNLGYTHFQRFETDDLYGSESMKWISNVPELVITQGKNGLFYLNESNHPKDASFHYFFCEIEHFLNVMPRISKEEDYEDYLISNQGSREFKIVEAYIYDNLDKNSVLVREGNNQMKEDFSDTIWNTVVSASNLPTKYNGCLSGIYRILDSNGEHIRYCLYSQNYLDREVLRRVVVHMEDSSQVEIHHKLIGRNSWWINDIEGEPTHIDVYEDDLIVYSLTKNENINSYIQLNQ